jgi:hypothetical protein
MKISTSGDKRIPNIFAYSETRSRDLTVPSIGKERIFTVAKPELKVGAITGILLKDENGEIRYEKVFQWCLPQFSDGDDDDESL